MYVLAKTSRCYYGGKGRKEKIYPSILDAANAGINDGNPVGFDVYEYKQYEYPSKPSTPVLRWHDFPEFFARWNMTND